MELNVSYNIGQWSSSNSILPRAENDYDLPFLKKNTKNDKPTLVTMQKKIKKLQFSLCAFYTVGVLALVFAILAVVLTVIMFTSSLHQAPQDSSNLNTGPFRSCKDIPQDSPSGEYLIQTSGSNSTVQVHCETSPRSCSCNTTGPWMRVANIDMTDPSQQCPDGFRLVNRTTAPLRTCGRPDSVVGCVSTTFPVHGIEYSHVCGRIVGFQVGLPDAFLPYSNNEQTIYAQYIDGISLTHGLFPRQHVWSFVNAQSEEGSVGDGHVCPCTKTVPNYGGIVPPFIGEDYFCDTAVSGEAMFGEFYPLDPLWDGQGCGGTSTCCSFNHPPWFCKQLPQPTTDDIELSLCGDELTNDEDSPFVIVELYVK